GGAADHAAEILGPEPGVLIGKHIGFDIAEGRLGLVVNAVIEGLDDLFFEAAGTRMRVDNRFTLGIREFGKSDAEHVHLDAGGDERDDGMHVLWDAGCRVQRNRGPHRIDVLLRDAVARRKSRATLAPSTSKRSYWLAYSGVRPMSWNMAPA